MWLLDSCHVMVSYCSGMFSSSGSTVFSHYFSEKRECLRTSHVLNSVLMECLLLFVYKLELVESLCFIADMASWFYNHSFKL
jgi:hypothetical protein